MWIARARCKRDGKDFYLPARISAAELERDQKLLDSFDGGLSAEAAELRLVESRARRARQIATGLLEPLADVGLPHRRKRKTSTEPAPVFIEQPTVQESLLRGEHARMVHEALAHEALKCFRLTGPFTEYTLLPPGNTNVAPGLRNVGNTCWLNATLPCMLHTLQYELIFSVRTIWSLRLMCR